MFDFTHNNPEANGSLKQVVAQAMKEQLPLFRILLDEVLTDPEKYFRFPSKWVSPEEAMDILDVSEATLKKIRKDSPKNGVIVSTYNRKIKYNRKSLDDYISRHSNAAQSAQH